jgi:hypothetical protein
MLKGFLKAVPVLWINWDWLEPMNLGLVNANGSAGVYAGTRIIDMAPGFLSIVNFLKTIRVCTAL